MPAAHLVAGCGILLGRVAREPDAIRIRPVARLDLEDHGPGVEGDEAVVPFTWQRDDAPGTMRLKFTDGAPDALDERLVSAMTVVFG